MARSSSVYFGLVVLCLTLHSALTTASPTPADRLDRTTVTRTISAALMPRGGTAENLPDNGEGSTPSNDHESGGPYNYGDYWYYCGNFATGNRKDLQDFEGDLMNDASYNDCWAPAQSCRRLLCQHTTAVYLCNDNDYELDLSCYNVGYLAMRIGEACCSPQSSTSGQMFHPTDGYNVVVGYGNCERDNLTSPYPPDKGNNDYCDYSSSPPITYT